jgi:hypothetical protein
LSEIQRFLFDGMPVRGMIVRLTGDWQEALRRRAAGGGDPAPVRSLLGQMAAAGVLMQASIRFNGALVLQVFGVGPVKLAVAEVQSDLAFRATASVTGDVPADGPSGEFEWNGYIPFDQLPWFYNPPAGLIVTANQNPFPRDYKYKVNGVFASQYRALQIRNLLSNRSGWKPGQILAVQKDVYSPFSHFLARQAVAAFDRKKPSGRALVDAASVLRGWDGQMDKDQAAPLVTEHLYLQLRRRIADNASPQKGAL